MKRSRKIFLRLQVGSGLDDRPNNSSVLDLGVAVKATYVIPVSADRAAISAARMSSSVEISPPSFNSLNSSAERPLSVWQQPRRVGSCLQFLDQSPQPPNSPPRLNELLTTLSDGFRRIFLSWCLRRRRPPRRFPFRGCVSVPRTRAKGDIPKRDAATDWLDGASCHIGTSRPI